MYDDQALLQIIESDELKIVYNESSALRMFYCKIFRVLLIVQIMALCKPTLHGYDKLARDQAHDILWPCNRAY